MKTTTSKQTTKKKMKQPNQQELKQTERKKRTWIDTRKRNGIKYKRLGPWIFLPASFPLAPFLKPCNNKHFMYLIGHQMLWIVFLSARFALVRPNGWLRSHEHRTLFYLGIFRCDSLKGLRPNCIFSEIKLMYAPHKDAKYIELKARKSASTQ